MRSKIFFGTKPRGVPAEHNMLDHKHPMIAGSAQCFKASRCLFGAEGSRLSIPSRCSCYKWYPKIIWPTSQQTCLEDLRIPVLAMLFTTRPTRSMQPLGPRNSWKMALLCTVRSKPARPGALGRSRPLAVWHGDLDPKDGLG